MSEAEEVVEEVEQEVEEVEEVVVVEEEAKPTRKNRLFYTRTPSGERVIEKY